MLCLNCWRFDRILGPCLYIIWVLLKYNRHAGHNLLEQGGRKFVDRRRIPKLFRRSKLLADFLHSFSFPEFFWTSCQTSSLPLTIFECKCDFTNVEFNMKAITQKF